MKLELIDNIKQTSLLLDPEKVVHSVCETYDDKIPTILPFFYFKDVKAFNSWYELHKKCVFYEWDVFTIAKQKVTFVTYDETSQSKIEQAIKFGAEFTEAAYCFIIKTE